MRARFSRGMSYLNLMSWRAGEAPRLPDAVVFPTSHQDVLDVLAACSAQGIAVVPVGGGTSVTGGVDTPDLDTVVVCSLDRMSDVQNLDTESGMSGHCRWVAIPRPRPAPICATSCWEVRVRWESSPPPTCACERSRRFASTPRRSCPGISLQPPMLFAR
ncbi:MAG: FAD-binding oxidoreductase [Actinobacteria bacterium]|nr:FAD-binding oxidoreductase [Actinomycetota bacterium]